MACLKLVEILPTLFGLIGVTLTLAAYALLQTNKMTADHKSYCVLNIAGSALILYSLCFEWNLSAFIMEGAWLVFSIYGLWRVLKLRRKKSS